MRSLKLSLMCSLVLFAAVALAAEGDTLAPTATPTAAFTEAAPINAEESPVITPEMTAAPTPSEVVYTPSPTASTHGGGLPRPDYILTLSPTAAPTAAPTPAPTEVVYTPPPTASPTAAPTEPVYTPPPTPEPQ